MKLPQIDIHETRKSNHVERYLEEKLEEETVFQKTNAILNSIRDKRFSIKKCDFEDISQEVQLAILKSIRGNVAGWNPRISKLSTWVSVVKNNKTADFLRRFYRHKRFQDSCSKTSFHRFKRKCESEQESQIIADELYCKMLDMLFKTSNLRIVNIFKLMAEGCNGKEISKIIGVSEGQISKDKSKIAEILKSFAPA